VREDADMLVVTVRVHGPDPDLGNLTDRVTTVGGELHVRPGTAGCEISLRLPVARSCEGRAIRPRSR
jgi:signal transduction histidine kinase